MKKYIALFAGIAVAAQAADEFRTFTVGDGRTLSAKVLSFDSKTDMVEIQRDDHQTFRLKRDAFSEGDQSYIRQWAPCSLFMSPSEFLIIPRRTVDESWSAGTGYREVDPRGKVSGCQYEIDVCNRSGLPMENLTLNYLIYYAYDLPDSAENTYPRESHQWQHADGTVEQWLLTTAPNIKVVKGSVPIADLVPGAWAKFATERVAVLERNCNILQRDGGIGSSGSSSGIIVTISMQTPDGGRVERRVALPRTIEMQATGANPTVGTHSPTTGRNS